MTKATPKKSVKKNAVAKTPATKEKVVKKVVKKTTTKKSTKKKTAKKGTAEKPNRAMSDLPIGGRRIALVKLMKKLGAGSPATARSLPDLAEKLGYTNHDVYVLVFHQYPLVEEKFVQSAKLDGQRGLAVYLTKKGQKADFTKTPFAK